MTMRSTELGVLPPQRTLTAPTWLGLPRRAVVAGAVIGAVLGVTYTLSPLTVWFAVAASLLLVWAGRDLPQHERGWVTSLLIAALAARVVVVAALFLISDHDTQAAAILFGDEGYALRRTLRLRNVWLGVPGLPFDFINAFDEYGLTSYVYLLAYLQLLVGPAPYGVRLLNAALFVAGIVLLYRLARPSYGPVPAFGGLCVLLFLPSLFFWSISLLKESLYVALSAGTLVLAVVAVRARAWTHRTAAAALWVGVVVVIETLRPGGLALTVLGALAGFVLLAITWRPRVLAAVLLVAPLVGWLALRHPGVENLALRGLQTAARIHGGHAFTVGHAYKLLDDEFYTLPTFYTWTLTAEQAGRFVVRGALSFITVPLPWQVTSRAELMYLPEQIAWYVLVIFAPIGIVAGFRRDVLTTCLLTGYLVSASAAVALTSGNVGTLIRHRSLTTPYVVWFSVLGYLVLMRKLHSMRTRHDAD